jgi:hypothetical protein
MPSIIQGQLEIDHLRGVIYFHADSPHSHKEYGGITILRVCNLPKPILVRCLDITHMQGQGWGNEVDQRGVVGRLALSKPKR